MAGRPRTWVQGTSDKGPGGPTERSPGNGFLLPLHLRLLARRSPVVTQMQTVRGLFLTHLLLLHFRLNLK